MKHWLRNVVFGCLLLVGLTCLLLTNTGVLSFGSPFVVQLSEDMPAMDPVVVIENVNLIPMDSERILERQTIVIRDGVIENLGHADQLAAPPAAVVIDGSDKYLMPGLVDMHSHIQYPNDLLLLVSNGVTSVRNMWGSTDKMLRLGMPDQLALQKEIEAGRLLGPTIYNAGPVMEGKPSFHPLAQVFDDPEQASNSVRWQVAQGYDFIKVYDHLSPEVYSAILETAKSEGIPVVGHVPAAVDLDGALQAGQQTIEHLSGYVEADRAEFIIPQEQLEEYAVKTREAGVWNTVTLSVYPITVTDAAGIEALKEQPGMKYQSPFVRLLTPFLYKMAGDAHIYAEADYPQRMTSLNQDMVAALHAAGAGILLGTDAAQPYLIPGFSIHQELSLLVEAGLSPYEALEAGTRNAALVLGKDEEFGTISVGRRADLLLLAANPLEDIHHVNERVGVVLRGRWLPEAELQAMLASLANSYQPNVIERVVPLVFIGLVAYLYMMTDQERES